ncbi:MAG: hypothetical protein IJV72_00485 [Clostridia bacterium]|nr:hypothetical protein [Clostridia bacterium]
MPRRIYEGSGPCIGFFKKGTYHGCVFYDCEEFPANRFVINYTNDLVAHGDNIGTEGEATFEDGMISCSALQMAYFALTLPENEREKYVAAAEDILTKHRCLEMNLIPDSRMRGSTIRFLEPQYDVLKFGNFITADHGWTTWKNYALYYLYLLTGKERYISELFDSMGGCCDNDVHEHFKCLEENVLGKIFVNVYGDRISVYGGRAKLADGELELIGYDETDTVYINSAEPISFSFNNKHYANCRGFVEL